MNKSDVLTTVLLGAFTVAMLVFFFGENMDIVKIVMTSCGFVVATCLFVDEIWAKRAENEKRIRKLRKSGRR